MFTLPDSLEYQRTRQALVFFGLVFAVIIFVVTATSLVLDWRDYRATQSRDAQHLIQALVGQIDHELTSIQYHLENDPSRVMAFPGVVGQFTGWPSAFPAPPTGQGQFGIDETADEYKLSLTPTWHGSSGQYLIFGSPKKGGAVINLKQWKRLLSGKQKNHIRILFEFEQPKSDDVSIFASSSLQSMQSTHFPYRIRLMAKALTSTIDWKKSAIARSTIALSIFLPVCLLLMALWWQIDQLKAEDQRLKETEKSLLNSMKLHFLGRISRGLARDFDSSLTVMYGQLSAIEQNLQESTSLAVTEKIRITLQRARDLVRRVLMAQELGLATQKEFELAEIAHELEALIKNSLPQGLQFSLKVTANQKMVGDPNRIYQMLLNLCANGLDSMREKGGLLEVLLARNHRGRFFIRVSDQGCGIAPDELEKIFTRYYTTKEIGHGTGLGLALVKDTANEYGISIEVVSRIGRGTSITLLWGDHES